MFPLSIGNQWTYRYFTLVVNWPAGNPYSTTTDSGRVSYFITGRTSNADSTSWQFKVQRDLMHHEILYHSSGNDHDSTYSIRDSSYFELIESLKGQHQVYRHADPYQIRFDVFPFTQGFVDTTVIYRFRQVGHGDTTAFLSWIYPPAGPDFQSTFTFMKGVGLIRNIYNSGSVDFTASNEHFLLNSIVTSIDQRVDLSTPSSFLLFQNYPNPFNPSTSISFSVPKHTHVRLQIFNLLGQIVQTLLNEDKQPGTYSVTWDASTRPAGLYFYRMMAGEFVQTKKAILLK